MVRYGVFIKGKLVSIYQSESYAMHKAELYNAKHKTRCTVKII